MLRIYNDTNDLKSVEGEMLNTYFVDPVNKNVSGSEMPQSQRNGYVDTCPAAQRERERRRANSANPVRSALSCLSLSEMAS